MSLLELEVIGLRLPHNATLVSFNHNLSILAYTYYSPTRKVYYVVIESLNPIRLCFRKKLTSLNWIFIDERDILITSFESGYIGCFDVDGRLLFKQQIDSKPILNIYLHSSPNNNITPNLLCLQLNGIILISSHDLYSTLKYSNFDISLLSQQEKKEYFLQIEYDKKKQQNKLKQQSHLKYSRNIHNKKYLNNHNNSPHSVSPTNRKFTFDDINNNRDNNNNKENNINVTAAISPRVIISPLPDDKNIDLLPASFHHFEKLKDEESLSRRSSINSISSIYSNNTPSSDNNNNNNKYNKYNGGVNSIPITTILPLRPIVNKILYWNAKKILISTDQTLKCFAACFFPLSDRCLCSSNNDNIIIKELDDPFTRRPHPGINLNFSTNHSSNNNLIQIHKNKRNLIQHHSKKNNNKNNKKKQYQHKQYKEYNDMNDLINPQIASKNNNDESWLILFCGSNPMIGAVHIEIMEKGRNIFKNDKSSQSVTNWFSAAKSLFRRNNNNNNNNSNNLSSSSSLSSSHTNNNESPSKCSRLLNLNIDNIDKHKNRKNIHIDKKLKNRDYILSQQKHTQHTIRDEGYNKYSTIFELKNCQFNNKYNSNISPRDDDVSIIDIVMSPDSRYGAFIDSFGRVWIWDSMQCQFIRIFKGYRRAQIAWCYINNDIEKLMRNNNSENNNNSQEKILKNLDNNGRANIIDDVVSKLNDSMINNNKYKYCDPSIPSYIYRRSILLLIFYISSRGLLEFYYIGCYKRLYAVNIFKNATMIYHLNYSVSPPWSTILFENKSNDRNIKNKLYKLKINSNIINNLNTSNHCKLRRINDFWDKSLINNSAITLLSDFELYFNGNYSSRFSCFGCEYISNNNNNSDIIQWFILVNKCDGDICIGIQLKDKEKEKDNKCINSDYCNYMNGWGYHCDGFLKHNGSFTRYGWKYGESDTIGIILNTNNETLKFSLNGKLSQINNTISLPTKSSKLMTNNLIYRLAVSVGLNSIAQLTIIGFSKSSSN